MSKLRKDKQCDKIIRLQTFKPISTHVAYKGAAYKIIWTDWLCTASVIQIQELCFSVTSTSLPCHPFDGVILKMETMEYCTHIEMDHEQHILLKHFTYKTLLKVLYMM